MLGRSVPKKPNGGWKIFSSGGAAAVLVAVLVVLGVSVAIAVFAQAPQPQVGLEVAKEIGLGTLDIRTMVGRIINAFFGLLGLVVVSLFLYAGFLWMTAQGNKENIEKATGIIKNATIGLIIMFAAYAITDFVLQAIFTGTGLKD